MLTGNASRVAAQGGRIVSHAPARAHWTVRFARDVAILSGPSIAVVVTLAIAWEMRGTPLTMFDGVLSPRGMPELYPSNWLTLGHAIMPVIFLIANLVNRRYGDDYTIAHILASWSLIVALMIAAVLQQDTRLPLMGGDGPTLRVAAAFFGAMILGQLAGSFVFDRTRGVIWWQAPLYSALTSSFAACFLFYPLAYVGADWIWLNHMSVDAGVKAAMSFALLAPYFLLRPIVRPGGGLGGF
jgi:uncharacterized PurR-regulated membrane protein YhhQ (DUF165 family)